MIGNEIMPGVMSGNEHQNPPGEQPPRQPSLPSPGTARMRRGRRQRPPARPDRLEGDRLGRRRRGLLVVAASLTAYIRYRGVWNSIQRVQISGLGKRPPQYSTNALNILLIGSDSRGGANSQFGATASRASGPTRS